MSSKEPSIGRVAARVLFRKRGEKSEAHLGESELAGIIDAAVALDREQRPVVETSPVRTPCDDCKTDRDRLRQFFIQIQRETYGSRSEAAQAAHKLACYALDGIPAEETSAIRDSIAPNKQCPKCKRFFWVDKFDDHDCRPEEPSEPPREGA